MAESDGFTVIVPAYNEEAGLERSLRCVAAGAAEVGRPFEILVVDDGSTDHTAAVARGHGATVIQHPRNMGYGAALSVVYLFIVVMLCYVLYTFMLNIGKGAKPS